jgi:hypothetical protein
MKGMSIEGIADVLEVQPASVKRWLARAAEQCDKVNDNMMKDLDVPKIEMDEQCISSLKNIILPYQQQKLGFLVVRFPIISNNFPRTL